MSNFSAYNFHSEKLKINHKVADVTITSSNKNKILTAYTLPKQIK